MNVTVTADKIPALRQLLTAMECARHRRRSSALLAAQELFKKIFDTSLFLFPEPRQFNAWDGLKLTLKDLLTDGLDWTRVQINMLTMEWEPLPATA